MTIIFLRNAAVARIDGYHRWSIVYTYNTFIQIDLTHSCGNISGGIHETYKSRAERISLPTDRSIRCDCMNLQLRLFISLVKDRMAWRRHVRVRRRPILSETVYLRAYWISPSSFSSPMQSLNTESTCSLSNVSPVNGCALTRDIRDSKSWNGSESERYAIRNSDCRHLPKAKRAWFNSASNIRPFSFLSYNFRHSRKSS